MRQTPFTNKVSPANSIAPFFDRACASGSSAMLKLNLHMFKVTLYLVTIKLREPFSITSHYTEILVTPKSSILR